MLAARRDRVCISALTVRAPEEARSASSHVYLMRYEYIYVYESAAQIHADYILGLLRKFARICSATSRPDSAAASKPGGRFEQKSPA